jgi:hypothetical protein
VERGPRGPGCAGLFPSVSGLKTLASNSGLPNMRRTVRCLQRSQARFDARLYSMSDASLSRSSTRAVGRTMHVVDAEPWMTPHDHTSSKVPSSKGSASVSDLLRCRRHRDWSVWLVLRTRPGRLRSRRRRVSQVPTYGVPSRNRCQNSCAQQVVRLDAVKRRRVVTGEPSLDERQSISPNHGFVRRSSVISPRQS